MKTLPSLVVGKTSAGVAPEVNLKNLLHVGGGSLALKPRGALTRCPKQGYQWTYVIPKIFKKRKEKNFISSAFSKRVQVLRAKVEHVEKALRIRDIELKRRH